MAKILGLSEIARCTLFYRSAAYVLGLSEKAHKAFCINRSDSAADVLSLSEITHELCCLNHNRAECSMLATVSEGFGSKSFMRKKIIKTDETKKR